MNIKSGDVVEMSKWCGFSWGRCLVEVVEVQGIEFAGLVVASDEVGRCFKDEPLVEWLFFFDDVVRKHNIEIL